MNKKKKPDKQVEQVSGIFWKALYRSNNGTRCVYQYSNEGSIFTVVGENLPNACLQATFTGEWRTTKQGRQFFADMAVCTLPASPEKIADYVSGLKVGISHKQAMLMVKSCGAATFWTELLSDPLQFCSVPGVISESLTALQIYAGEVSTQHELFSFFGTDLPCNGPRYKRICDYFDHDLEKVVSSIKHNPFVLMNCGYTFKELDRFCAKRTIFPLNDYRRMIAASLQVLQNAKAESHVGLPHEVILDKISFLLREQGEVTTEDIAVFLANAEQAGDLVYSSSLYYLPRSFAEECTIADGILHLLIQPDDTVDDASFEDAMARYETKKGFSLSSDQRKAVRTALEKKLLVITGGPGTGKSATRFCVKQTKHRHTGLKDNKYQLVQKRLEPAC